MPVIKQSTRSSNIIVSDSPTSGKNEIQGSSNNNSPLTGLKPKKEKEYQVRLDPSIFKKNMKSEMLRRQGQTSNQTLGLDLNIEEFGDLESTTQNIDSRQREELQNPNSIVNRLSSSFPENRINLENQDSINRERASQLGDRLSFLTSEDSFPVLEDFLPDQDFPESDFSIDSFSFTSLGKLIERSRKSLRSTNIKVLSHEIFKLNKQTQSGNSFNANLLFLDTRSQANSTLLNLRNSEIEKKESLSDRLFIYIDDFKHNEMIQESYSKSLDLVNEIDLVSTLGNKLENEVNYGNIIENFIKEGNSQFIGKISNQILTNSKNYNVLTGNIDKTLLDLQEKNIKSILSKEDLDIFYKNISGFNYEDKDTRFTNSVSNFKIINTDRLVGQFMINCSIANYSLYPNSDEVDDLRYYNSLTRKKINGSAFNKYPIIQFKDINLNSRIFKNNKLEFLAVNGKTLDIQKVVRNSDKIFTERTFLPYELTGSDFKIKSYLLFSASDITNIVNGIDEGKYSEGDDIRTRGTNYSDRISLAGKAHPKRGTLGIDSSNLFDNNVFSVLIKDLNDPMSRFKLFEKSFLDVDTKSNKKNEYLLPSFVKFPTRYIASNNQNTSLLNPGDTEDDPNQIIDIASIAQGRLDNILFNKISTSNGGIFSNVNYVRDSDFLDNDETEPSESESNLKKALNFYIDETTSDFKNNITDFYLKFNNNNRLSAHNKAYLSLNSESMDSSLETHVEKIITSLKAFRVLENRNLSVPTTDQVTEIVNKYNESLQSQENRRSTFSIDDKKIKNDCFVFKTSNSFLTDGEISKIISSRYDKKVISTISESASPSQSQYKRIKNFDERFLNKENTTDNTLSIFKKSNDIPRISLKISNVVNSVKKIMTNDSIFQNIFEKAKSKVIAKNDFIFLYDREEENSIDTFENSPFITKEMFYRNNFSETFDSEIKNTTRLLIDEGSKIEDHPFFTSKEFRKYLSKSYTNSFLRNKTSFLNRILKDNIDLFEKENEYPRSTNVNSYLGFDILLAKALSGNGDNSKNSNICKLILANAIFQSASIENQVSSIYKKPANKIITTGNKELSDNLKSVFGDDIINSVVSRVFNKENLYTLDNKVIRSAHTRDMKNLNLVDLTTANSGDGSIYFSYIEGNMCELMFPGHYRLSTFGSSRDETGPGAYTQAGIIKTLKDKILTDITVNDKKIFIKRLYEFNSNIMYNHDIFFDDFSTGVIHYKKNDEDNEFEVKGYNFDSKEKERGIDLKINYRLFNHISKNDPFIQKNYFESNLDPDNLKQAIAVPYKSLYYIAIPMSYFYLSKKKNTFSKKITEVCADLLAVLDVKYDNINNSKEVLSFIEENTYVVKILQEILEIYSIIFLQSHNIYNTLVEEKIRLESINKDLTREEFEDIVKKYNFSNASQEERAYCISDLKSILDDNIEKIENPTYQKSDVKIANLPFYPNRELIYSKRFFELQIINKMLNNSDISEALSLDIIHGYFSNLEFNKSNESGIVKSTNDKINMINQNINSIQGIDLINIKDSVFNEFYQNKLSKDIQELMFYKNIFNETFIRNNLYNSNRQKYENENMFNHRRLYYTNSYYRGIQSLNLIGNYSSSEVNSNLDILRIPIDFNVANRIGTRGFLKINIQPVNLKYPEIEYKTITKYYTPMLAGLTSNFMSSLSNNFFSFCGIYNDTQKTSERYNVVSKDVAISEVKKLLVDIFSLKAEENQTTFDVNTELLSTDVYDDNIISSAVSHLDFITQSSLSENIKVSGEKLDNLISKETITLLNSVDIESLKKAIEKIDENILSDDFVKNNKEYAQTLSNSEVLKNNEFYHKFIKDLDRDISQQDLILAMIPNNIYDVFNIVIDRDIINIDTESSQNEITDMGLDYFNSRDGSLNKNLCISYYISFEVL